MAGGKIVLMNHCDLGGKQETFFAQSLKQPQKCPQCGSNRLYKAGLRYLFDGATVQRWLCRECNYRFSRQHVAEKRKTSQLGSVLEKSLKTPKLYEMERRESDEFKDERALNLLAEGLNYLVNSETQIGAQREGTQTQQIQANDINGKILNYLWEMKKNNATDATIKTWNFTLKKLAANTDMTPDNVKEYLAKTTNWSDATKQTVVVIYNCFLKFYGITWKAPKYKAPDKLQFIPTEAEIDTLIAGSGKKLSAFLQFLKETAARGGEAAQTKWTDVDFERKIVHINNPEKGSKARILPISNKLIDMLNRIPKQSDTIFPSFQRMRVNYHNTRKSLIFKLQNPRLKKIHLHTFRHWKATTEYHKTKDIIHVQQMLGHRNIDCTMIYITLENTIYSNLSNDYTSKTATTIEEACKLIDSGFEYVTDMEGVKLFRKRK